MPIGTSFPSDGFIPFHEGQNIVALLFQRLIDGTTKEGDPAGRWILLFQHILQAAPRALLIRLIVAAHLPRLQDDVVAIDHLEG